MTEITGKADVARRRFPWLAMLLGVPAIIVLLGLGTWQVQRLQWKEALIATISERTHAAPLPLGGHRSQIGSGR